MKYGAFNMTLKSNDKVYNGNTDTSTTQESFQVEITNEHNTHHFL